MLRNQAVLDRLFEKAAAATETLTSLIKTGLSNNFTSDEPRLILAALLESLGTQLEILKTLRSEIEASSEPS